MENPEAVDLAPVTPTFKLNRVTRRRIFGAAAGSLAAVAGIDPVDANVTFGRNPINQLLPVLRLNRRGLAIDNHIVFLLLQFLCLALLVLHHGLYGHNRASAALDGERELGPTTGGNNVEFTPEGRALAEQLYRDTQAQVRTFRKALKRQGITPPATPTINLDGVGCGFLTERDFFGLVLAIIGVNVSVLVSLLLFLANTFFIRLFSHVIRTSGSHTGALSTYVVQTGANVPALDSKSVPPTADALLSTSADGLTIERTAEEAIAALAPFFPNGLAGLTREKFEEIKRSRS